MPHPARAVNKYVLVETLLQAQAAGTVLKPLPSCRGPTACCGNSPVPLTLDEAYEVGAEIARRRLRQGWSSYGWKVGFTNREIWSRWGLNHPIVAPVYRETVFAVTSDGATSASAPSLNVPAGRRAALRIEVEVVFGFETATTAEVAGPVPDWVALGAELVDCHYLGWELHPAAAVADFGLHAGLVVGPRVPVEERRAMEEMSEVAVSLRSVGSRLAGGSGRSVLGGPANVLAQLHGPLAARTACYGWACGRTAPGGQGYLVSTGTLTPLVEARIGATYEVEADRLPSFSFALV